MEKVRNTVGCRVIKLSLQKQATYQDYYITSKNSLSIVTCTSNLSSSVLNNTATIQTVTIGTWPQRKPRQVLQSSNRQICTRGANGKNLLISNPTINQSRPSARQHHCKAVVATGAKKSVDMFETQDGTAGSTCKTPQQVEPMEA